MEDLKKSFLVKGNNIIGALGDKNFSTAPLGTVLSFAGQTAPHGYLLCDGASYKVADYPHLYTVIGNTYGGDDTNFNVPNLVDKFIQGSNTSGTEKEAGLPNITGLNGATRIINTSSEPSGAFYRDKTATYTGNMEDAGSTISFDASRSNPIYGNSDTVQPPALTMVYIIKAFHTNEGTDSGVSDDVIEYVEGEIAKVESKVDGLLDNSSTSTTSTWSSSKIAEYVAENATPSYSGTVIPTSIANGATVTTDWNIQSAGSNADYGRLLMLNSSAGTFLIYVKGNLGNTSTVPTPTVISSIGNSQSATWNSSFELSISSGKLRIKNKSGAVASWRFV